MKLKLTQKREETADCTTFIFEPEQEINWQPGQFLQYDLPDSKADDRGEKRFFTIASAPFEKYIQITTRFVPGDGSSFKQDLKKLEVGAEIEAVSGPAGGFTVDDPNKNYVFLAGGIGITPFRSILVQLDYEQKPLNVVLLYANRDNDIVFKSEFDQLAQKHSEFKVDYIIDPQRIDTEKIKSSVLNLESSVFYLSGPKPFVDGMKANLEQLQVSADQIKTDYFPGYN